MTIDPKHTPTLDALRKLGKLRASNWMIEAKGFRLVTAFDGVPNLNAAALASLIADLLNEALKETR